MKKFLGIIVLGLLLSGNSMAKEQALDICGKVKICIKDFKIENMGIGDSLIKYFDEKKIKELKKNKRKYKNNKYTTLVYEGKNEYDEVWVSYLTKDKSYEIAYIKGIKVIGKKQDCRKAVEKFKSELISSWNMTLMKTKNKKNSIENYMFGASALDRNWFWGVLGCSRDTGGGFNLYVAPHTETWAKWNRKALIDY